MGDGCKDVEMKQFSTPSGMNSRRSRLAVALQYFHFFRAGAMAGAVGQEALRLRFSEMSWVGTLKSYPTLVVMGKLTGLG